MDSHSFEAIGTGWQIDLPKDISKTKQTSLIVKIRQRINEFDHIYSRFRQDSLITKISQKKGKYKLPDDAKQLFSVYKKLYQLTDGLFTPLIAQALSEAGYDTKYSLKGIATSQPPDWNKTITYNSPYLTVAKPVLLDFGAAGKGYLIDIVAGILQQEKIDSFIVDAGGDIFYYNQNKQSLKVGLEDPNDFKKVIGVAKISNQSICSSAGNRRQWGTYHHLLNPTTLTSPRHILSSWAIAQTTLEADALATCLFFVDSKTLAKEFEFEYLLLYPDYSIEKSDKFPAEIFYKID